MAAHGTPARYHAGCHCAQCCAAEAARAARWRAAGTTAQDLPRQRRTGHGSHLDAVCWCEATIARIPRADVLAGRTHSCGAGCHEGCRTAVGAL